MDNLAPTPGILSTVLSNIGTLMIGIGTLTGTILGWLAGHRNQKDAESKANASNLDAISRRFEILMDGYEQRIRDLTAEVHNLREEVASLRSLLGMRGQPPRSTAVDG